MSGCASTDRDKTSTTNNFEIFNVTVKDTDVNPDKKSQCDKLLDECAIVVEKQHTAIEEQKKLIDLQEKQVNMEQEARRNAEQAKSNLTVLSILQGVALFLLILL